MLDQNPGLLAQMRATVIAERERLTWDAAAAELTGVYLGLRPVRPSPRPCV